VTTAAQTQRLPELASQLIAQAPTWILGLLFMLLCARAALLVVDFVEPPIAAASTATALPAPSAARKVVDIPSILRANLFGQSAVPTGTDAPVTSMNLRLVLVFAANDPKRGLAGIGTTPTDVKIYQVGADVPGGAQLHSVYVDRVLLDRGGSIEALLLPPREGTLAAAPPPAAAVNPAVSVERVQQAVRNNPGLINQIMSRQAVFQNGRLRGLRVNPGPNAQAFARLGLRPNDIVTAINGTTLDDQARSNEIFDSLSSAPQARVTIVRNDREQELTLNLAEIANEAERLNDAPPPPPGEPDPDSTR
jgi:general secretion pathway protein C